MKASHIPTAILICLFLISCEKGEGIYSAKEKIIHVYSQTSGWFMNYNNESGTWEKVSYDDARYCSEEWTWDHRRLASIKYTERNGSSAGLDQFTYNGGLIVEKKNSSRGHRTVYTYVDNELTNIQWYVKEIFSFSTETSIYSFTFGPFCK